MCTRRGNLYVICVKKARTILKYRLTALKRHRLNAHKFNQSHIILSLWELFTRNQRVLSKWIHVHLRPLAHVSTPCVRTNKWPGETHFTKMVCNAPVAPFCLSSLIYSRLLMLLLLIYVARTYFIFSLVCWVNFDDESDIIVKLLQMKYQQKVDNIFNSF